MRKKSFILCGFTIIMGIFGAFLRWLQLSNILDTETDLVTSYSPWSFAMALFALLGAVVYFLWVRSVKDMAFSEEFPSVYSDTIPFVNIAAFVIGAFIAIGGVMTLIRAISVSHSVFDLILGLFSLLCAAGMTSFILSIEKPAKKNSGAFGAAIIVFFLCFWLVSSYKFSASEPAVWKFAPRLLAVSATLLAYYFVAGFVFNKPRPLASLYFCLLGSFMCLITLADSYPLGEQLIAVGFALSMLLLSFSQLSGAKSIK